MVSSFTILSLFLKKIIVFDIECISRIMKYKVFANAMVPLRNWQLKRFTVDFNYFLVYNGLKKIGRLDRNIPPTMKIQWFCRKFPRIEGFLKNEVDLKIIEEELLTQNEDLKKKELESVLNFEKLIEKDLNVIKENINQISVNKNLKGKINRLKTEKIKLKYLQNKRNEVERNLNPKYFSGKTEELIPTHFMKMKEISPIKFKDKLNTVYENGRMKFSDEFNEIKNKNLEESKNELIKILESKKNEKLHKLKLDIVNKEIGKFKEKEIRERKQENKKRITEREKEINEWKTAKKSNRGIKPKKMTDDELVEVNIEDCNIYNVLRNEKKILTEAGETGFFKRNDDLSNFDGFFINKEIIKNTKNINKVLKIKNHRNKLAEEGSVFILDPKGSKNDKKKKNKEILIKNKKKKEKKISKLGKVVSNLESYPVVKNMFDYIKETYVSSKGKYTYKSRLDFNNLNSKKDIFNKKIDIKVSIFKKTLSKKIIDGDINEIEKEINKGFDDEIEDFKSRILNLIG